VSLTTKLPEAEHGMPSLTVENYVKTIFQVCAEVEGQSAATGRLAAALGVSPGTVTSMLKTLSESNLATYTPYEGARLTPAGNALALRVVRRHRLIELFLVRTLSLTWDEVHEEAENMEHAVSDRLVDRIDAYLGYPVVDPHGDPIPKPDGSIENAEGLALCDCPPGRRFRLLRVLDQSPDFLRYLSSAGLTPGTAGAVVRHQVEAGIVTLEINGQQTALARDAAEKILVEPSA